MMHALDVLRATGGAARAANQQEVEAQLCTLVVDFSKKAYAKNLGGWLHVCADVLAGIFSRVLAKSNVSELLALLEVQIKNECDTGNFWAERTFIEKSFTLKQAAGLAPKDASCQGALGESYEREAKAAPTAMHAEHALRHAVDAYRKARRSDDADRAAKFLERAAADARAELKTVSFTISFSRENTDAFFSLFDDSSIEDALMLSAMHPSFELDPDYIAREAESNAKTAPLMRLIPVLMLRPENTSFGPNTPEEQKALEISQTALRHVDLDAIFLAEIFRRLRERGMRENDVIKALYRGHIFIPQDLPFLLHGIRHWLSGDHLSFIHVIVPCIEKVLRRLCRNTGPATIRVRDDGTEQLALNGVLENLQGKLPSSLVFALKVVLVDRGAWALRHITAHGLEEASFFSATKSAYLMHLLLAIGGLVSQQPQTE
ncbi:MAG TPA: hypothetical protein VEU33_26365 [Archangium sp.]|nr:hypothetical protein [Archangium sp.]